MPDVGPAVGRVVEDVVELGLAGQQVGEHVLAGLAQVLGHPVQELGVADLVLDLGREGQLALEGRGPQDPLPLGQHAHQLGVGVHLDEPADGPAVLLGHPVGRLHLATRGDVPVELLSTDSPRRSPARSSVPLAVPGALPGRARRSARPGRRGRAARPAGTSGRSRSWPRGRRRRPAWGRARPARPRPPPRPPPARSSPGRRTGTGRWRPAAPRRGRSTRTGTPWPARDPR